MNRLSLDLWENILRNTAENGEEVEVIWLDDVPANPAPHALVCGEELFEDGFETEEEAQMRLEEVVKLLSERKAGMVVCKRCGNTVDKSVVEGYTYSCNECEEDLFTFETRIIEGLTVEEVEMLQKANDLLAKIKGSVNDEIFSNACDIISELSTHFE